jgi:hypothetical protein
MNDFEVPAERFREKMLKTEEVRRRKGRTA